MRTATTADAAKILELLGIKDRYIRKATIYIDINMPVRVEIEIEHLMYVNNEFLLDEGNKIKTALKKYRLVEIEEEKYE